MNEPPTTWRFGTTRFEPHTGVLTDDTDHCQLRPKTANLLTTLLAHAGEVMSKERLLTEVWAGDAVSDNTLTQSIQEIRRALGDDARAPRYVETLPKRGYRWIALPVEAVEAVEAPVAQQNKGTTRSPMFGLVLLVMVLLAVALLFRTPIGEPTEAERTYMEGREALGHTGTVLAKSHFQHAIELDPALDEARLGLAQVAYFEGEWNDAKTWLGSIGSESPAMTMKAESLAGEMAYLEGRLDDAMRRLEKALALAEQTDSASMQIRTHRYLDEVRRTAGHPPLPPADPPAVSEPDPELSAMTAFYQAENLNKLREALARYQELGATSNQAITRLAMAQSGLLDPPTELDMLRRSATMLIELGNRPMTALVHNRLARHHLRHGDLETALQEVERALELHRSMGARLNETRDLQLRGTILYAHALAETGDTESTRYAELVDRAEHDLTTASAHFASMGCPTELGLTTLIIASLALDLDRLDEAEQGFAHAHRQLGGDPELTAFAEQGASRTALRRAGEPRTRSLLVDYLER